MIDPTINKLNFMHYAGQLKRCINKDLLAQISCRSDKRNDRLRSEVKSLLHKTQDLRVALEAVENE
jgi:hypothetical protein